MSQAAIDLVIDANTNIRELISRFPEAVRVFTQHGLPCAGCHVASYETIAQGAKAHSLPLEPLLQDLRAALSSSQAPVAVTAPRPFQIKHTIAVGSGKGGVGKSLVTALLAVGLRRQGLSVGILDADITGPSIPRMFGLGSALSADEGRIVPAISTLGIALVSAGFLVEREDAAIAWRGPLITSAIKQFYEQTNWGDLDYLLIDLPPGTSDAPLTVLQSLPVEGLVVVSSPQALATAVVSKLVSLAQRLAVPVVGVVENMSYILCPETGRPYELFGPSQGQRLAQLASCSLLARLPIDPELSRLCDSGQIESYKCEACSSLAEAFTRSVPVIKTA